MTELTRYQRINPLASALAAACTETALVLVFGLPMLGMGGMMNGYGGMMSHGTGFFFGWWLGGAVVAAFAGALFAWIYNAVNR